MERTSPVCRLFHVREGRDSERASEVQRQSPGLREGLGTGDTHRAPSGDGGVPERGTERERSQIGPSEPERDPVASLPRGWSSWVIKRSADRSGK